MFSCIATNVMIKLNWNIHEALTVLHSNYVYKLEYFVTYFEWKIVWYDGKIVSPFSNMRVRPDFWKLLSVVSMCKELWGNSYCHEIDFCLILVNEITYLVRKDKGIVLYVKVT